MKNLLAVVLLLLSPVATPAEVVEPEGTILSRQVVTLPDEAPAGVRQQVEGVVLEWIVYVSDGLAVEGYLAQPAGEIASPLPSVIYLRGGNRDFAALNPVRAAFLLGPLAQRGYVVAATNYRGNGTYGAEHYPGERTCEVCEQRIGGEGREEFGGAEVDDVLALLPLLEALPEADASRVGLYGWSRGGMMTWLVLRRSDRFQAAIVGAGVSDFQASGEARPEMVEHVHAELIPGWDDPEKRAAAIEARSAVRWADELPDETPVLLLHGTGDWRVAPTQSLDMAKAMLEAKKPFRLLMLEGGDHGLTEWREEVDRVVGEWLDRYVRDGEEWPSLEPHGR
ncbi:MAG TPA: prolyl oligopeptidase family serine peptidase [Thermoanaerobaculia bacterium]|nr:prolyl oligopeptidase family serine peptidase [Thermoanaerobaculia bacterium]